MSSKNNTLTTIPEIDTKSLKQREQAQFYAIDVRESRKEISNQVVKTRPPIVNMPR